MTQLPPNRQLKKLSDLTIVFADGDWVESKDQSMQGIRLIQTGNIGIGAFKDRAEKSRYISEETFNKLNCTEIFENDCLVSRLPEPVGRSCLIPRLNEKLITAVDCTIIRFHKDTDPKFYVYYTQCHNYQNQIESKCSGSTRKRISRKNLSEILIPLPPLATQLAIVDQLDKASAQITASKSAIQSQMDALDQLWQSALSEVFSNKEYDKKELGKVIDNYDGKRVPIKSSDRKNGDGGKYPYYGATGIIDYIDEFIFDGSYLLISEDGANLIARKYPIAFIAEGKFRVNNHAHIVKGKQGILDDKFLKYFIDSAEISQYITGSAQPKLSQGMMNKISVPLPDLATQTSIVLHLDEVYQHINDLKANYQAQLQAYDELWASILDKAFKGELVSE